MKTKFTTVLSVIVAVLMLTITTQKTIAAEKATATEKTSQVTTKLVDIKNISKIKATGNVEIFLSQGSKEAVTVYDHFYGSNALIQVEDGELRISSYTKEPLQIWVQVDQLQSIEASGNAKIKSLNKISALDLSISLSDSAVAVLNTQSINSKANVDESSSLTLTGSSDNYSLSISGTGKVDATSFTAGIGSTRVADDGQLVITRNGENVVIQSPEKV